VYTRPQDVQDNLEQTDHISY